MPEDLLVDGKYEIFRDWFPYDDETIDKMYDVKCYGMPVSFILLDSRKTETYCHFCANFLNLVIPGSVRVKGRKAVLNGGYHSWVEVGDYVYDTTALSKWRKEAYYDRDNPYDIEVVPFTEVWCNTRDQRNSYGIPELYVAWIRDLEEDMEKNSFKPYGKKIKEHIARFAVEEKLHEKKLDEEQVLVCYNELQELYSSIAKFKEFGSGDGAKK